MPGFIMGTDLDRDRAVSLAIQAAREQGFSIEPVTSREFLARRGSLGKSILLGPFRPYCRFRISALDEEGGTEVTLQRNTPWWTSYSGVRKVHISAEKLANAIDAALGAAGGQVFDRREY